jgi:hypothetical protein
MPGNFILPNANRPNWHSKVSHESCTEKGVGDIQTVVDKRAPWGVQKQKLLHHLHNLHNKENWQILINM